MKIIDNFLSDYYFGIVESFFMGDQMPWYYKNNTVREGDRKSIFTTSILQNGSSERNDELFSIVEPCIQKLGCKSLFRIKANCELPTFFHRKTEYHIDLPFDPPIKTSIYYVNTNNGWTHIKGHGKVKSVANRMVTFDSNQYHAGVTCTNEERRVVVNFNWK